MLKLILSLCAAVTYGFASFFLIQGTKRVRLICEEIRTQLTENLQRNHVMTQPFRVLCFVGIIVITFEIILMITKLKSKNDDSVAFHHIMAAIVALGVEFYVLLVVDSVYKCFRDEKFHRGGFIIAR